MKFKRISYNLKGRSPESQERLNRSLEGTGYHCYTCGQDTGVSHKGYHIAKGHDVRKTSRDDN